MGVTVRKGSAPKIQYSFSLHPVRVFVWHKAPLSLREHFSTALEASGLRCQAGAWWPCVLGLQLLQSLPPRSCNFPLLPGKPQSALARVSEEEKRNAWKRSAVGKGIWKGKRGVRPVTYINKIEELKEIMNRESKKLPPQKMTALYWLLLYSV